MQGYYRYAGADKGVFVRHTWRKMGAPNSDPARPRQTSSSREARITEGGDTSSKLTWWKFFFVCLCVACFWIKTRTDDAIILISVADMRYLRTPVSYFFELVLLTYNKGPAECAKSTSN